jgi:mono/diheme cytochrome c family protein
MLLSFWSLALVSALSSADETDKYANRGRAVYVQLCVVCHGPSGKADGPAAAALRTPPADLTQIGRRYSEFPTDKIMTWIDGEKASVAHGTREMPVWGRTFRRQRGEAEALGEVYALTRYLQSIQQK